MLRVRRVKRLLCLGLIFVLIYFIKIFPKSDDTRYEEEIVYYNDKPARIFCMILTSEAHISINHTAKVVYDAWANECDQTFFIAQLTNETLNESIETHDPLPVLQLANLEIDSYDTLTDKMFYLLHDVATRHGHYDWYLKADDNTFVFVKHLRQFLSTKNSSQAVTYGYDFKQYVDFGYHSGGAGYVLSRKALELVAPIILNESICNKSGMEDLDVGNCLRQAGVKPGKSVDKYGRERFHPLPPYGHYYGLYPPWMYKYSANPLRTGIGSISDTSISFHYVTTKGMKRMGRIWKMYQDNMTEPFSWFIYRSLNIKRKPILDSIAEYLFYS